MLKAGDCTIVFLFYGILVGNFNSCNIIYLVRLEWINDIFMLNTGN